MRKKIIKTYLGKVNTWNPGRDLLSEVGYLATADSHSIAVTAIAKMVLS